MKEVHPIWLIVALLVGMVLVLLISIPIESRVQGELCDVRFSHAATAADSLAIVQANAKCLGRLEDK